MDEKESRTRKKLTNTDKNPKKTDKPDAKKAEKPDTKKAQHPDTKKAEKPEPKKADKQEPKKTDKHKYPLACAPSKSFMSLYVSKECEDLLWASIRSRR
jgi:hypothetical protein